MMTKEQLITELNQKVVYKNDCWLLSKTKRRPCMEVDGKSIAISRLIGHLFHNLNLDSSDEFALHSCNNEFCVNPEHIYVGCRSQNTYDMVKDGIHVQTRKLTCPKGHEYDRIYSGQRMCSKCMKAGEEKRMVAKLKQQRERYQRKREIISMMIKEKNT